jgi:hypothetical protein
VKKTVLKKTSSRIVAIVLFIDLIDVTILAMLMLFILTSCGPLLDADVEPTGVAFFESTGGWDYRRIPLIEPYEAVNIVKETWGIGLETDSIRYQPSVSDITKLDVVNSKFILTYSLNTALEGERVDELWFIIIPEENIERGFTKEEDFLTYLKDKGIDHPNLTDVSELYDELVNKGYLEWFPEEYKE